MVSLQDIRAEAVEQLRAVEAGPSLDEVTSALIGFAVRISVTTLDSAGAAVYARQALAAGATTEQLHEAVFLVSGLGVHSLFEGSRLVEGLASERHELDTAAPLDDERQKIWDKRIGNDKYWLSLEREAPGFLKALLRATTDGFEAFFRYCAVPWKSTHLSALTKELISMAVDATPTHRFLPGMRLHLANAVRLGAGRDAVLRVLEIAAEAPAHPGVR
ncbi:MAG: carboxymuconolactone decarboxylase family protein [Pseudomonadota bacterium]